MYCTRADIEAKRIAYPHLVELVDDEATGEFYDGAGAVPPTANTQPLYSNVASELNKRVNECIEDADNEINAYLNGVYPTPLADGSVPAIINTLSVNISTYYLYVRRNNPLPEPIKDLYAGSVQMLKQLAARKISLAIPKITDAEASNQASFAVRSTASIFAEIPY